MTSPRIYILSAEETPVLILDNDAPEALHYYSDSLHTYLTIGGASTFTFTVDSTHEDAHLIEAGMKVSFRFEDADWYFTITGVDRDEMETVITSEGLSFEFLNEEVDKYEAPKEMTFLEYLDAWGFERDILKTVRNDIATVKKKLKFETCESILKRLSNLATEFKVEVKLSPKLTMNGGLKEIQMSLCASGDKKGVGTDLTSRIVRWGSGPESIRKTTDLTDFCSRLRPRGKTEKKDDQEISVTLSGYTPPSAATDPDGYTYVIAYADLCCPQARDRYPSSLTKNPDGGYIDGYVVKFFEDSNADTQEKLYASALAELRKLCRPKVSYEIRGTVPGSVGDWLTVEDAGYAPIEYYQCRMTEKEVCVSTGEVTSVKLDNFTETSSKLSQSILSQIAEAVDRVTIYDCRISSPDGTAMDDDGTPHTFSAIVRKGAQDVTSDTQITWYLNGTKIETGDSRLVNGYQIRLMPEDFSAGVHVLTFSATQGETSRGTANVTLTRTTITVELADDGGVNVSINGKNPHKIPAGSAGKDGFSPTISASKSGKTTTLTITDKNGTKTTQILDGNGGQNGNDGTNGKDGIDGVGIISVVSKYYQSASSTAPAYNSSSWVTSIPSPLAGQYLHTQVTITMTDGTVNRYYVKVRNGTDGSNGTNGQDGQDAAEITGVTIYYYRSSSSSAPTSTSSFSTARPTITSTYKYLWAYEHYTKSDGTSFDSPIHLMAVYGDTGATGPTGATISSITGYYYRSTSQSSVPADSSFSTTRPTLTSTYKYLWTYERYTLTNGSTVNGPKHIAAIYGDTGATGATGAPGTVDEAAIKNIVRDAFFPVGAIYITYTSTNPGTSMGGTWTRIAQGRVLVGQGTSSADSYGDTRYFSSQTTGGSAYPLLTPRAESAGYGLMNGSVGYANRPALSRSDTVTKPDLMPPYQVVYYWRRTA